MSEFFNDLFIFEMANSHQGSVEHGISIINEMGRIAKKYNIKAAVKLQYRNLDTFIHPNYVGRTDIKHIPRFESTKMSYDNFCRLVEVIHQNDMISMSTPFDEVGVEWCLDQDIDVIKVASCSCMDWPLLEKVAKAKKPVIISTGGKVVSEIDKIYNFFTHRNVDFALMHCIAEYPAPESHIQLDFLEKMQKRYRGIMIGYSGHENPDDNIIPMMAIAKGASIMERHVGLPTESITLNSYSMNPGQAEKWVEAILRAKNICVLKNYGEKYVSPAEVESLLSLSRGVFVKNAVKMGDKIYKENVFFAMPAAEGQLLSGSYDDGMIAT